ncbi:hypothetical protein ACFQY4_41530 [Catellatospora bangladeshensis]|uniref:Integral membrane protein n=1 Tax=Catellatospora bangladeshensis TaxID=310355 RepID=A0A8J3JIT8_9ACTN|nr:hypothetical protein [Catellatospora bangladeshensis]GIF79815.1 hypothetical protein Cba03nite_11640 [Catellatospora bangladeshensis]
MTDEPVHEPSRTAWEQRLAGAEASAEEARTPEPPPAPRGRPARTARWIGATLLALLAAVLVVASVTARYARSELLDTDRYVETVAPLASDPQVQAAITDRVTHEIMARLPLEKLAGDLAAAVDLPRAQSIIDLVTPAVSSWLQNQIHKVVGEVVTSPRFSSVWIEVNRRAHQNVAGLLTGQGGPMLHANGTDIVIDLGPVLAAARQELVDRGFGLAARIPDMSIPYTVAQVDQLPEIQRYVRLLDVSATWLPPLALALLGLAVWTAPNRRRGLILGLLLSAVLLGAALLTNQVVRDRVMQRATERGLNAGVALDVYDTLIRFLLTALVTVLVAALLGVLWALLAGPSRPAVLLRRGVNAIVDRAVVPLARQPWAVRAGAFVRRHFRWFAVAVGVLAAWWLLARPSVATAIWAFVCAAIATLLLTLGRHMPATVLAPAPAGIPGDEASMLPAHPDVAEVPPGGEPSPDAPTVRYAVPPAVDGVTVVDEPPPAPPPAEEPPPAAGPPTASGNGAADRPGDS